jgi:hypothetical protein
LKNEYQLDIEVMDVNDCAPRFIRKNFHFRVSNETMLGSSFGQIQAIDEDDSLEYRQIRYQFLDQENEEEIIIQFPSMDTQWNRTVLAIDQENHSLFDQSNIEIIFFYQKTCLSGFSEDVYTFNTTEHQSVPYEIGKIHPKETKISVLSFFI